jgi:hypothetical protein
MPWLTEEFRFIPLRAQEQQVRDRHHLSFRSRACEADTISNDTENSKVAMALTSGFTPNRTME